MYAVKAGTRTSAGQQVAKLATEQIEHTTWAKILFINFSVL